MFQYDEHTYGSVANQQMFLFGMLALYAIMMLLFMQLAAVAAAFPVSRGPDRLLEAEVRAAGTQDRLAATGCYQQPNLLAGQSALFRGQPFQNQSQPDGLVFREENQRLAMLAAGASHTTPGSTNCSSSISRTDHRSYPLTPR